MIPHVSKPCLRNLVGNDKVWFQLNLTSRFITRVIQIYTSWLETFVVVPSISHDSWELSQPRLHDALFISDLLRVKFSRCRLPYLRHAMSANPRNSSLMSTQMLKNGLQTFIQCRAAAGRTDVSHLEQFALLWKTPKTHVASQGKILHRQA